MYILLLYLFATQAIIQYTVARFLHLPAGGGRDIMVEAKAMGAALANDLEISYSNDKNGRGGGADNDQGSADEKG